MHDSCIFLCILSVAVIIFKDQRRRRTMNTWTRKLTNKQKRRKWAKDRGIFSVVIPVEGRGGGGVRVLRKVTRIVIEGFLGEFQIFLCRIFGGKKIWKVPFGGGRGAMLWDLSTFSRGGEAWFKTIWKLVLHGTFRVYHLSKYNPDCFAVVLFTCKFSSYLSLHCFFSINL